MPASKEQEWKPEEDALLRKLINQNESVRKIVSQFPERTERGVYCRVYTLGLKSGTPRTFHSKDEKFWEIPNPLNCYYAGLAAADMNVGKRRATLSWTCEKTDEYAMILFKKVTNFSGEILHSLKKSPRSENVSIHCTIRISAAQKWMKDLSKNFNIIPDKARRLEPPSLQNDYLKCCYLIGYTDGDGCMHVSKQNMPVIRFVSASKSIIEWIKNFTDAHFSFKLRDRASNVVSSKNENYYSYYIYGMSAIKMFEFLRQINVPKFDRKWSHPGFLQKCQEYRTKWPEFFTPDKELEFDSNKNIIFRNSK